VGALSGTVVKCLLVDQDQRIGTPRATAGDFSIVLWAVPGRPPGPQRRVGISEVGEHPEPRRAVSGGDLHGEVQRHEQRWGGTSGRPGPEPNVGLLPTTGPAALVALRAPSRQNRA